MTSRLRLLDVGWAGIGQVGNLATSLVVLGILTTSLGLEDFGVYSGSAALASIVVGLAILGAGDLLFEALSRPDPVGPRVAFGRALATCVGASAVCLVLLALTRPFVVQAVPAGFLLPLAASEFATNTVLTVHARLLQYQDRFAAAAVVSVGASAGKALAVIVAVVFFDGLRSLAVLLLTASLIVLISTTLVVARANGGRPVLSLPTRWGDYRRGFSLALGQTSLSVNSGADQTILLRSGLERETGLYGLGVRAVSYSLMPVWAYFATTYPEYFRRGAEGYDAVVSFARQVARRAVLYGVLAGVALVGLAVVARQLLSSNYADAAVVIAVMAGFPLLRIGQSILGDILTGLGHFAPRSAALVVTAALNVGTNLWAIPRYGWRGAAATTYLSELAFLGLLAIGVARVRSRAVSTGDVR